MGKDLNLHLIVKVIIIIIIVIIIVITLIKLFLELHQGTGNKLKGIIFFKTK